MVMVVLSSGNRMKSNLSRNFFPLSSYPETTCVFSRWEMSPRLTLFLLFVEELGDLLDSVVRVCVR